MYRDVFVSAAEDLRVEPGALHMPAPSPSQVMPCRAGIYTPGLLLRFDCQAACLAVVASGLPSRRLSLPFMTT